MNEVEQERKEGKSTANDDNCYWDDDPVGIARDAMGWPRVTDRAALEAFGKARGKYTRPQPENDPYHRKHPVSVAMAVTMDRTGAKFTEELPQAQGSPAPSAVLGVTAKRPIAHEVEKKFQFIKVQYTDKSNGDDVVRTYAVDEDIARELNRKRNWLSLQNWLGSHIAEPLGLTRGHSYMVKTLTGKDLETWLVKKGCHLGASNNDSPIEIRRSVLHEADGSYYTNETVDNKSRQVRGVSAPLYGEVIQHDGGLKGEAPDLLRDTKKPTAPLNQKRLPVIKM